MVNPVYDEHMNHCDMNIFFYDRNIMCLRQKRDFIQAFSFTYFMEMIMNFSHVTNTIDSKKTHCLQEKLERRKICFIMEICASLFLR